MTAIYFTLPYVFKEKPLDDPRFREEVALFISKQQEIKDSIRIERIQSSGMLSEELAARKIHPFPFDPNKLPREQWRKLGLTERQIDIIKNYEAKGGRFRVKEDLKKLYGISEAEYKILEPYIIIKLPFERKPLEIITSTRKFPYRNTELNAADSATLVKNLRMPSWMAARVIKYRKKLGGFYDKAQLLEVYGMKKKYYEPIKRFLYVDTSRIEKICVNQIRFKKLIKHPYLNYELTKKIFEEKKKQGGRFDNIEKVLNIVGSEALRKKLSHYLYICPPDAEDN